jgi:hypothetical protein
MSEQAKDSDQTGGMQIDFRDHFADFFWRTVEQKRPNCQDGFRASSIREFRENVESLQREIFVDPFGVRAKSQPEAELDLITGCAGDAFIQV